MIFDTLKNTAYYESIHPRFKAAFAFLEKATREDLPVGRYELEGSDLFAMVQEYETNPPDHVRFEGHRRYIDIQYLMRGVEVIEVTDLSVAEAEGMYSDEKDACFFKDHAEPVRAILHAGEYGVFLPHDIHKPGMALGTIPAPVKKIVVKIKI
ncbi:MAG: YhcH/YjgK/YiaL family protein [Clostridia bacterium]|nr:YhcH/YjgK/YiaL family protein [Clostridia bacterium]